MAVATGALVAAGISAAVSVGGSEEESDELLTPCAERRASLLVGRSATSSFAELQLLSSLLAH